MAKRVRVVAALLSRGGRVLVQQRRPDEARALQWEFPGGKVEAKESDAEALLRECREELGIEVSVQSLAWASSHRYPDLEVDLSLYRCALSEGEPQALHAHAVRWALPGELPELTFCEADRPLIPLLAAGRIPLEYQST